MATYAGACPVVHFFRRRVAPTEAANGREKKVKRLAQDSAAPLPLVLVILLLLLLLLVLLPIPLLPMPQGYS